MRYLLVLLLLSGCVIPGLSVRVNTTERRCRGAVIGSCTVVTVMHCVKWGQPLWVDGMMANAVSVWPSFPEPLVVIKFDSDDPLWSEDEILIIDSSGEPVQVLGPYGPRDWTNGVLKPGYSGSPVVDIDGELVGLAYGVTRKGDPIMIPIPRNWPY